MNLSEPEARDPEDEDHERTWRSALRMSGRDAGGPEERRTGQAGCYDR